MTSLNAAVQANRIIRKHFRKVLTVKMLSLWKVGHSSSFSWHLDISPLTLHYLYGNKLVVFHYCIMNTSWIIGVPDINLMHCDILFSVGPHCAPEAQWIEWGGVRTPDLGFCLIANLCQTQIQTLFLYSTTWKRVCKVKICCIFKAG